MSEKWEVVEAFGADVRIEDGDGNLICALYYELGNGEYVVTQCWDDHAPRIAALPELEANYKEAVEVLQCFVKYYQGMEEVGGILPPSTYPLIEMAKETLAKAEGK